jgi:hypothetical protein
MTTTTSRPVSMIFRNYNTQPRDRRAPPLVVVHALIVPASGRNKRENKPHRATTTSRSVSMISTDHNLNPVIGTRPRW